MIDCILTTNVTWSHRMLIHLTTGFSPLRRCGGTDPRRGLRCGRPLRHGRQGHYRAQPQPQRTPQTQQRHHEGSVARRGPTAAVAVTHAGGRQPRPAALPHQLRAEGRHHQRRQDGAATAVSAHTLSTKLKHTLRCLSSFTIEPVSLLRPPPPAPLTTSTTAWC